MLRQPSLTEAESERIKTHFLLSRQRLLEIIAGAGRMPQVQGGGELTTFVSPHDYSYPQLYLVKDGSEYSRFDRFHVNLADDGTGVDEIMQILSGNGVRLLQQAPGGGVLTCSWTALARIAAGFSPTTVPPRTSVASVERHRERRCSCRSSGRLAG